MAEHDRDATTTGAERTPAARLADHAAIERLAGDLLPALIARLAGTGLGELEVREGGWRLRLRRPASGSPRPAERSGRAVRGRDGARDGAREASRSQAHGPAPRDPGREDADRARRTPLVATSPAVGVFRTRGEFRAGTRVRAGDRLAVVDLLGVPQDVVAAGDAIVAAVFVEDGDAVEYGQPLLALEPAPAPDHESVPQAVPVG